MHIAAKEIEVTDEIELSKLERQLLLYEVFLRFLGLELETILQVLPLERRMLQRDVKDLTDAGLIKVRFDKKSKQYIRIFESKEFVGDDSKISRHKHLLRLQRLGILITSLWNDEISSDEKYVRSNYHSCKDVYTQLFPNVSDSTMQRDFRVLNRIGYHIVYNRKLRYYEFYDDSVNRTEFGVFKRNGKLYRIIGEYDFDMQYIPWWEIENPDVFEGQY